jgi:hypothetical protein
MPEQDVDDAAGEATLAAHRTPSPHAAPTLSVSIVIYRPELEALRTTCQSLVEAIGAAQRTGVLGDAVVDVIDNGTEVHGSSSLEVDRLLENELGVGAKLTWQLRRGHGNVGYGQGHNLAIHSSRATYHLILNPDVRIERDAMQSAIAFLETAADVGLLTPEIRGPNGERQHLCRTYPSVLTLLLRGFAPAPVRRLFDARLARYEMRDRPLTGVRRNIPIVSGCFMLARRTVLASVGGFHPGYFLYFEDYDLSLEMGRRADIAYVDSVRIVHWGGGVPTKGLAHVRWYVRSALTFFSRHGWRLW